MTDPRLIETASAFVTILIGHLLGDFLFQNHRMQMKNVCSWTCTWHVLSYGVFVIPMAKIAGLSSTAALVIILQHWLQDRFELHRKWMVYMQQSPNDKWPGGSLFIDQAMHLVFIWLVCAFTFWIK